MADYKAAYEREKQARKQAEELLENRARALYLANEQLTEQFQQLTSEFQQKTLLLSIARYSQENSKLSEILPEIIGQMLSMATLTFGLFDYFPIDRLRENYRSPITINKAFTELDDLEKPSSALLINEVLDSFSVEVLYQHEAVYILDLKQRLGNDIVARIERFGVNGLLAMPIVANNHTAAIIYFFVGNNELGKEAFLDLFESSLKQLGVLIEHRYNEDQLESSFYQQQAMLKELNMTQNQLVQSEKMASIGQLSAGIAHEINNPVGYIKSNINSLKDYQLVYSRALYLAKQLVASNTNGGDVDLSVLAELEELWRSNDIDYLLEDSPNLLKETQQGLERVVGIVSGLKSFARASDQQWHVCNINECLQEALKLSHNELKYKSVVDTFFLDVPLVNGNACELIQVFLNLLINAGQAVAQDGRIVVATRKKHSGVEISVIDNGKGITEDNLQKIFDPFFTTKEVGEGTGLGLSISFGIVESHQGKISVESICGEGTTFSVWLPASPA